MALILVIDDDDDTRTIMQDALQSAGHEVILASHGAEGLQAHQRRTADLVITDIFMPEKDGVETVRDLRQQFPAVKIIAMSGGGKSIRNADYLATAAEIGADRVMHKPFTVATLLDSVQGLLKVPADPVRNS